MIEANLLKVTPKEIYSMDGNRITFFSTFDLEKSTAAVYYLGEEKPDSEQWFIRYCLLDELLELRRGDIDFYSFFKRSPTPIWESRFSGDKKNPTIINQLIHPKDINDDSLPSPHGYMEEEDFFEKSKELENLWSNGRHSTPSNSRIYRVFKEDDYKVNHFELEQTLIFKGQVTPPTRKEFETILLNECIRILNDEEESVRRILFFNDLRGLSDPNAHLKYANAIHYIGKTFNERWDIMCGTGLNEFLEPFGIKKENKLSILALSLFLGTGDRNALILLKMAAESLVENSNDWELLNPHTAVDITSLESQLDEMLKDYQP